MIVDGELYGGLSFGTVRRERTWPEELLERMGLLAQIFGSALARKRAQEELDGGDRLRTPGVRHPRVAVPCPAGRARAARSSRGSRTSALFLGLQRVSLWERVPHRDEFRRTHHWQPAGLPAPSVAPDLPWVSARLIRGVGRPLHAGHRTAPGSGRRPAEAARARGALVAGRAVPGLRQGRRRASSREHARRPHVARGPRPRGESAGRGVREPARAPVGRAPEAGRGGRGGAVAGAPGASGAGAHGRGDVGRARPRDHPAAGGDRELRAGCAPPHERGLARPRPNRGPAGQGHRPGDARRRRGDAHARHGAAARARAEGDRRRARGQGMRRHGEDGLRAARHPHRAEARPVRCRWSSSTRSISSR